MVQHALITSPDPGLAFFPLVAFLHVGRKTCRQHAVLCDWPTAPRRRRLHKELSYYSHPCKP